MAHFHKGWASFLDKQRCFQEEAALLEHYGLRYCNDKPVIEPNTETTQAQVRQGEYLELLHAVSGIITASQRPVPEGGTRVYFDKDFLSHWGHSHMMYDLASTLANTGNRLCLGQTPQMTNRGNILKAILEQAASCVVAQAPEPAPGLE